ncbi:DUF3575 domain-containing protein [Chryseobacterium sp. Y16C]|uniref:DUF3575 domain-containing protein n=1 Tax=Chryseobacterium sp. Y16C TaxID=2920939 RepID=UPI001F0BAD50|nr:DUF3575 domain-containing protein [Chryseobacterium sp. Y16C]UMQ43636.1 DUF3575 domain-containing protein [Chryseobacterium sp. Y16C]
MKNKILISLFVLFALYTISAQTTEVPEEKSKTKVYIKGNALFIPIGIVNVGVEHQLNKKITLQGDVFISPWKSFSGHELQYYSASFEGRYYFDEAFKHWFVGANIGVSSFVLQKWSYWNDDIHYDQETMLPTKYISSQLYQKGYSILLGITAGYQFNLSERWNMELYATVGHSQDFYKGYVRGTDEKERYDRIENYNKSGEIIPYRGGIMISYKLK